MPIYNDLPIMKLHPSPELTLRPIHEKLVIESILDVGAGHGGVFDYAYWTAKSVHRAACDIHWIRPMDACWHTKLEVDVHELDKHYSEKSFDLVQCMEVLEHVENPRLALEQLCKVAKKLVLISSADEMHHGYNEDGTWNPDSEQAAIEKINSHQKYLGQPKVSDLLDLGFEVRVNEGRRQLVAWKYIDG